METRIIVTTLSIVGVIAACGPETKEEMSLETVVSNTYVHAYDGRPGENPSIRVYVW